MKITEFKPGDRPREMLLMQGAAALDDARLLAILLRAGTRERNVLDVARDLLDAAHGSLCNMEKMSLKDLCRINGIGRDKAITIKAAMELSRRLAREQSAELKYVIDCPEDAVSYLSALFSNDQCEECWALFLKRSRRVIGSTRISQGGISSTDIDTAGVVRKALDLNARSVILAHNHPSGSPEPSSADITLTERLRQALSTFNISLTDHIILSDRGCYSFSQSEIIAPDF